MIIKHRNIGKAVRFQDFMESKGLVLVIQNNHNGSVDDRTRIKYSVWIERNGIVGKPFSGFNHVHGSTEEEAIDSLVIGVSGSYLYFDKDRIDFPGLLPYGI